MSDRGASARGGLVQQLSLFHSTFWIANTIEVVERFAYYGLRTVLPLYMVLAYESGGPQFNHEQKGVIFFAWAMVQSFVPIFTGGFADRYGYKRNIAIATAIKIFGYLIMGWAIEISALFTGMDIGEFRGAAGGDYTYPVFFLGAMLLAAGTAIFKPGLQGLIANRMPAEAASFGWGIFYQMVNIGGFVGPLIAAVLLGLAWKYVFVICAVTIALNFLLLLTFPEPERKAGEGYHGKGALHVIKDTVREFLRPRVFFFTLSFAGFWLMFYQLFDILPNFIDDWVDSRGVVGFLQNFLPDSLIPITDRGGLNQAWMINLDAGMIMIFAFLFGYVTGKMKSLPAMCLGIAISAVSIWMLGMSMDGWWCLFAIGVFAIGEMVASPTKLRFMNEIAPKGKEGLFLGFANATVGIGWSIGSLVAGGLYEHGGDKVNLALADFSADMNPAAIVELLDEEELVRRYATMTSLDLGQVLGLLAEPEAIAPVEVAVDATPMPGVLPEHAALIPAVAADGTKTRTAERARALLATLPEPPEGLADASANVVVGMLADTLSVDLYDAQRLLVLPVVRAGSFDLGALGADADARKDAVEKLVDAAGRSEDGFTTILQPAILASLDPEAPKAEALSLLQRSRVVALAAGSVGQSEDEYTVFLWETYKPYSMWTIFALIGTGSMVLLIIYDRTVRRYDAARPRTGAPAGDDAN